jgi:hypothetical protein
MEKEMEEEEANLVGGDDSAYAKGWSGIVEKNVKMMKDNPQQLEAYNKIISSINDTRPNKKRLFFVEGMIFMKFIRYFRII